MRRITNQEMSDVTGANSGMVFDKSGAFAWSVTDSSVVNFDDNKYYASYVEDKKGNIVFSGHSGEFINAVGRRCVVSPYNNNGNMYVFFPW